MAQALYRKWRPSAFEDVVGQDHVTTTLKNQIATGRIGHAYLFVGSRGCGKTTSARIFAKEIGLSELRAKDANRAKQIADAIAEGRHLDLIEIDAASHTSVDDIRDLRDKVAYQPSELRFKVYIIDEVHMLSTSAFNALLKTLEEPPPHVVFILATTDPQKIPATVLSRCQRFNFRRIPVTEIVARLRTLCDREGIEAEDGALTLIARHATGALRDAESLLDQLASSSSMRITAKDVRDTLGATDTATVRALIDGLLKADIATGLDAIQAAVDHGADARQLARQTIDQLRAILQARVSGRPVAAGEMSEAEKHDLAAFAERANAGLLMRGVRAFSNAINEMRSSTDAQMQLELAYLECVLAPAATAVVAPTPSDDAVASTATPGGAGTRGPAAGSAKQHHVQTSTAETEPSTAHVSADLPAAAAGSPLETLRAQWPQLLKDLKASNPPIASILGYCQLWSVEGEVVQIKASQEWQRSRLEDTANKGRLNAALSKLVGSRMTARVFVGQAPVDPATDPIVRKAEELGGRVRKS
ncbi:MAG: DNA polymerase III subunit gamma/tau [Thermoflexales bacterium]|nr:DNA polymerase III subunit gamma/tau [Thermoflexales bacterium]